MYTCKFLPLRLFLPALIFMTTDASARYRLPLVDKHVTVNSATLGGEWENADLFGSAACAIGDVNKDQVTGLIANALCDEDGENNAGALASPFLNSNGILKSYEKHSRTRGHLTTFQTTNDSYDFSATGVGDLNSDGYGELAVGANKRLPGTKKGLLCLYNVQAIPYRRSDIYPHLKKKLDAGFYITQECEIKFKYEEEYAETDGRLTFNVYNENHEVVRSDASDTILVSYGDNRCHLSVYKLPDGYYILEVINQKQEKWYLRFKHNNTFTNCGIPEYDGDHNDFPTYE